MFETLLLVNNINSIFKIFQPTSVNLYLKKIAILLFVRLSIVGPANSYENILVQNVYVCCK